MSIAFSCLQLNKFYSNIELVTDKLGKKLIIDMLGLPYSSVVIELDQLNNHHRDLWALGKIYAYSIQKEPFLHIDNDVFIWARFDTSIENAAIVVQSEEFATSFFAHLANKLLIDHTYLPQRYLDFMKGTGYLPNYNAGVLGGSDLNFIKEYTQEVFEFIKCYAHKFNDEIRTLMNVFYEQFFLYCLSRSKNIAVEFLFNRDYLASIYENNNFRRLVKDGKYLHVHHKKINHHIKYVLTTWVMLN